MRWSALSGGDKIVITTTSATASTGEAFTLWDLLRVGLKTTGFYFKKLLIPLPLNFGIVEISPHYLWLGLAVCIGLLYCLYLRTTVAYLLLASFCLVSPALILPLLKITWTPVAERYAYIAAAPFVLALSLLFVGYLQPHLSPRLVTIGIFLLLAGAGTATAQRNLVWQDNLTLFEDTVRKSPTFAAAKNELAIALNERGRKEEAHALLLANSGDDYQPSTLNKVRVYLNQGKLEQAHILLLQYQQKTQTFESLELQNKLNEVRLKEAQPEHQQDIWREMLAALQQLLQMTGDQFYHYRIGQVQLRLGEKAAAKQSFATAYKNSSPTSHYHEAARKLAERL
jgi:tetratricopeptide (TPR) repeat protein